MAFLFVVIARTTVDAVGPSFPLIGIKGGFNTIELQEVSAVALLLLELVTLVDLLWVRRIKFPDYAWVGMIFITLLFVGGARTHSNLSGYSECLRAVTWVMIIVILPQLINTWKDVQQFIVAGCIAILIPILGAFYSIITGYKVGAYYGQMMGGLAGLKDIQGWHQSPPNLGVLVASLTPFLLYQISVIKKWPLERLLYVLLLFVSTYVVYRTYNRISLLALAVQCAVFALIIKPTKKKPLLIAAGIFVVWLLAFKMDVITIKKQDFNFAEMKGESSIFQRMTFWVIVTEGWIKSGWSQRLLGHGIHAVKQLTWGKSAHNDFFNMLYDAGLVPLMIYLGFLGMITRRMWKLRKRCYNQLPVRALACAGISILISSMLIANTMRFLYSLSWMIYIAIFISLCLGACNILEKNGRINIEEEKDVVMPSMAEKSTGKACRSTADAV